MTAEDGKRRHAALPGICLQITGDDHVVIPPIFFPEVRKLPDDVLSFPKALEVVSGLKDASSTFAK